MNKLSGLKAFATAIGATAMATATHAQPWDGAITGKVGTIDVAQANNFAFRVSIGGQAMCTNGPSWAYVNAADANYKAYMSLIMLARSMDKPVVVFSTRDTNGFCQIGFVSMPG